MLPTHVFADVVRCLPLYDLDALFLTDARCSDVAHLAATEIRVFDFSGFQFDMYNNDVVVSKMADGKALAEGMTLEFLDDADLADFIPAALRNCILGNLGLIHNSCFDAMSKVAQTVVVKDTLVLFASMFVSVHALVELVARFRSVKVRPYFTRLRLASV